MEHAHDQAPILGQAGDPGTADRGLSSDALEAWTRAWLAEAGHLGARAAGRLLGAPVPALAELSRSCEVLAPAERQEVVPPRLPRGHLARVVAGWGGESGALIASRLQRREVQHQATCALLMENAALFGPRLFVGHGLRRAKVDLFRGAPPALRDAASFDEVVLGSGYAGARWFGHLIHDELPMQLLGRELGPLVAHAREPYGHEPHYRAVFGVPAPPSRSCFFAKRCTVLVDHAQNESKRRRYAEMRERVPRPPAAGVRLYVRRAGGAPRAVPGEEALVEALERRGFVIVTKGVDPVERIIATCAAATQIVGVDGSHLAPTLFLAPLGAELVLLMPPDRASTVLLEVAQAIGLRTAVYVGAGPGAAGEEVVVDPDELTGFLDAGGG